MGQLWTASVTIDHTKVPNTDQTNFPVLVSGTFAGGAGVPDLRTIANGGKVNNSSGFDVAFYSDAALTVLLKWETDVYTAASGVVAYWVKIPTVSHTADTVFYIAYGDTSITTDQSDKANVWDANFKGVYHMGDGVSVNVSDSTGTNNGTNNGTTAVAGKIAGAANFVSASSQDISLGSTSSLNIPGDLTISAWIYGPLESTYRGIVVRGTGGISDFYFYLNNNELRSYDAPSERSSGNSISANTWAHVVLRRTGTTMTMYFNGVQTGSGAITVGASTSEASRPSNIGSNGAVNQWFNGRIDEVHISNVLRAADWVVTEYNNQNSPSTFFTMGTQTAIGATGIQPWIDPNVQLLSQ